MPRAMLSLATSLASGASIKDIYHERAWLHTAIDQVQVKCVIELRSEEHGHEVRQALEEKYTTVWGASASAAGLLEAQVR